MDQSAVGECTVCFADVVGKENDFTTEELRRMLQHCYPCLSSEAITHTFKHVVQSTANNNDFILCRMCFPLFLKLANLVIKVESYKRKTANATLTLSLAILQRRSLKTEKSIQRMEIDATNLPRFLTDTSSTENQTDIDQQQEYFRKQLRRNNIPVNQELSNENVEYLAAMESFGNLENTEQVRNDCSPWNTGKVTGSFFSEGSVENTMRSNGPQHPDEQNAQTPIGDIQNDIMNRGGDNFQRLVHSPVPSDIVDFYCDYFPDGVPQQNNLRLTPLGIVGEEGRNALVEDFYNVELQCLKENEESVRNKNNAQKSSAAVRTPSNAEMSVEGMGFQNNSTLKLDIVEIEILGHNSMAPTNETVVPASSDINDAREILSVSNVRVGGEGIANETTQNPDFVDTEINEEDLVTFRNRPVVPDNNAIEILSIFNLRPGRENFQRLPKNVGNRNIQHRKDKIVPGTSVNEVEILEEHLVTFRNRPVVPNTSVANNPIEILSIFNLRPGRENFKRLPKNVDNRKIQRRKDNFVQGTSVNEEENLYVSTGLTNRKRTFDQIGNSKDTELPARSAKAAPTHETIVSEALGVCNRGKNLTSLPPSVGLSEATKTLPEVAGIPLPSIADIPKETPLRRSCRKLSKRKNTCTLKCCEDGQCTNPKSLKHTPKPTTPEGNTNQEKQLESNPEHQSIETSTTTRSTSKASYKCLICKISYVSQKCLQNHLKNRPKGKPMQCSSCTEVFCTIAHLAKHRRIHSVRGRGKP